MVFVLPDQLQQLMTRSLCLSEEPLESFTLSLTFLQILNIKIQITVHFVVLRLHVTKESVMYKCLNNNKSQAEPGAKVKG